MHRFASQCAMLGALGWVGMTQAWAGPISFTDSVATSPGVSLSEHDAASGVFESFQAYVSTGAYVNEEVSRSAPFDFFMDDTTGQAYAYQDVTRRSGRDVVATYAEQNYAYTFYRFATEAGTGFNYVELSFDLSGEAATFNLYGTGLYGKTTHPRTGAEAKVFAAVALDGASLNSSYNYSYYGDQWNTSLAGGSLAEGKHLLSVDNFPGGTVDYVQLSVYSKPYSFFEKSYFEGTQYTSRELILVTSMPVPEPAPVLLTLAGCAVALRMRHRSRAA